MSDMREKIAGIMRDAPEEMSTAFERQKALKKADAIIDALPDMVKPMSWPVFSEGIVHMSASPSVWGEVYSVRKQKNGGWAPFYGEQKIGAICDTPAQGMKFCGDDRTRRIMSAFGL